MNRRAAAAVILTVTAVSACTPKPNTDVDTLPAIFDVTCADGMACDGELQIESLSLTETCRYGVRSGRSSTGFDAPGDSERYLEALGEVTAYATDHPDGVLLDELQYLDSEGTPRQARYVTNCREADDGRVFWTKNVAEGRTWQLYQTWIVPADTEVVIVEKQTVSLPAVS